jgi:hypothetical protein
MALPNIRVYIRPDSIFVVGGTAVLGSQQLGATFQLGAPAGALVELTSYVQQVSVRRGRTRVTDSFDAGSASVSIIDRNAIFSPDNVLSPLYVAGVNYVKPLRQFRITATFNSVEYDLFNGYTNSYDYEYEQGIQAGRVTISASDAFRLLNLATINSITSASLSEPSGTRIGKLLTQIGVPNGLQSIEEGDSVVGPDPTGARSALEAIQQLESTELGAFFIRGDGVFAFKARHTVQQLASGAVTAPLVFNEAVATRINLVSNPSFESGTTGWASANTAVRSTSVAFAGSASYQVTMSSTSDSNIANVTVTPTVVGPHTFSAYVYTPVGSTIAGRTISVDRESGTATSSLVSSTNATLTAGQWTRVSVTRNVTVVGTMIMVMRISGTLSTALTQVVNVDGVLMENSASANVYMEGTVAPAIPFHAITQSLNDEAVYNDVTVSSQAGVQQIATDATSIATYFTRSLSKSDTLISSTSEAGDHALFLLNYRKDPELYIDSIDLKPTALPTATAISLLTAEILDPITVTKSYGRTADIKRTLTIQGIDHNIRPSDWTMTFATAEPVSGDGFILDSATYGVLDVNTLSF